MPASQDRLLKSTTVAIKSIFVLICAFIAIALVVLPALILVPEGVHHNPFEPGLGSGRDHRHYHVSVPSDA